MSPPSQEKRSGGDRLKPGAPAEPVPFGKYYLLGLIARGGMAEVYRARLRDTDAPQLMAIKVMRPQLAREPRFVDMFNREGQLAMMLKNQSIVYTSEVGRIDGRHYIAMEYIPGRDLTQCLRRCQEASQRFPIPHAVYIAARIAEGLDFAHNLNGSDGRPLNIVNRDVSPSNVRLSYDGEVKMLDFGIAQALMKFTSEIGVLKGKFSYMSPEQIRGMPLDARTDIFSAGIILHEMLTTEKLFRGDTEFALMEKVRKADVPPPSTFNRRINEKLDSIVLRALARDVSDRYQSAAQLRDDLDGLLEGYRFHPRELQQFIRQLFRKEYQREQSEIDTALSSLPESERLALAADEASSTERMPVPPVPAPITRPRPAVEEVPSGQPPEPEADESEPRREGFWSRIMRRKR
ncbi:serine/threonine protein kinase [Haliangium ochraceum]|uniref:Serine/threonine protein kinase n=1 Tax=Haliangium ochraceum (strain DSM 14365 / JCM 11303 / SMP-2) TaxID=502025 RepID=D0LZK3_HALO1|nr:serine/threonine-protein kinase [Haliangium ochraceum]ACY17982.1 serine/threonine protein kinase [Haliangium ochraceum DSM 14365]